MTSTPSSSSRHSRGAPPGPTTPAILHPGGFAFTPVVASRRIASHHVRLLLAALLALGHALVLADSHLERLSLAVECSRLVKADAFAAWESFFTRGTFVFRDRDSSVGRRSVCVYL